MLSSRIIKHQPILHTDTLRRANVLTIQTLSLLPSRSRWWWRCWTICKLQELTQMLAYTETRVNGEGEGDTENSLVRRWSHSMFWQIGTWWKGEEEEGGRGDECDSLVDSNVVGTRLIQQEYDVYVYVLWGRANTTNESPSHDSVRLCRARTQCWQSGRRNSLREQDWMSE